MSTIIYKYYIYINVQIEFVKKKNCTTLPKGNKIMPQLTKVNETTKVRNDEESTRKRIYTKIKGLTPSNYIRYILVYIYIYLLTDI